MSQLQHETSRQTSVVRLSIAGIELDFHDIALTLGVSPTKTFRLGDSNETGSPCDHDEWIVESPLSPYETVNTHLEWLVSLLKPRVAWIVRSVSEGMTIRVYCDINCETDQCGFEIAPQVLNLLAELAIPLVGGISLARDRYQ
jgi:hypothetical protein